MATTKRVKKPAEVKAPRAPRERKLKKPAEVKIVRKPLHDFGDGMY